MIHVSCLISENGYAAKNAVFVSWDSDLIPQSISEPANYPGPKESVQIKAITTADRIEYFARSASSQLGQIKNLYLKWAHHSGPHSSQCQELNRLFSQCVDASKITIPDRLKDAPQAPPNVEFILDILHTHAVQNIGQVNEMTRAEFADSAEELEALLTNPAGQTQFELAQMTLQWCATHKYSFTEFQHLFDTTSMSTEEKLWCFAQIPVKRHTYEDIVSDIWQ